MVQGWACCSEDWGAVPKLLASAGNRPVITFDPRGYGHSPSFSSTAGPESALEVLVDEVLEAADIADVRKMHVFGISFGGMAAQRLATRFLQAEEKDAAAKAAGRSYAQAWLHSLGVLTSRASADEEASKLTLSSLVLCSTTPGGSVAAPPPDGFLETFDGWSAGDHSDKVHIAEAFVRQAVSPEFAKNYRGQLHKAAKRFVACRREAAAIESQAEAVGSFNGEPDLEVLKRSSIPTLVLHGDSDVVFPPGNAERIASLLGPSRSKLEIVKASGHLIYMQQPKEFVRIVSEFLDDAEQKQRS